MVITKLVKELDDLSIHSALLMDLLAYAFGEPGGPYLIRHGGVYRAVDEVKEMLREKK